MHTTQVELENITLEDLLTVDTHGERIHIQDRSAASPYELVSDRQTFFKADGLFADVENNGVSIVKIHEKIHVNLDTFLEELDHNRGSSVVLLEGFAGCGKSTLVQYILSKQLKTYNYDYSFYNYDLEAQNDLLTRDKSGNIIRKSSIYEAIKKSFFEQFIKAISKKRSVVSDFATLLKMCKDFQPFNSLYYDFYNTDTFDEICSYIDNGIDNQQEIVIRNLSKQSGEISSSACLLALDYILRLAMYKNRQVEKLYICYDNLDAIENAEDLKNFDDNLADFRVLIDSFIIFLQEEEFFCGLPTPHFVIIATYRKITAIMANIAETAYKEVKLDKSTESDSNKFVYHIDATSIFSYSKIVAKREAFFERYFKNASNISEQSKQKLLDALSSWNVMNQKLAIMNDRYACLWNKNYRTCSHIANILYSESSYDFANYVNFIENGKTSDGYDASNDDEGNPVLCTYYGGSAILLSSVCKVFNNNYIWSDLLHLTPLNPQTPSYKNVSLSRLILTYMYTSNKPVSLSELFSTFCKAELFSENELCHILAKMLARNLDGVWRRPIYYSNDCILSENAFDIEQILLDECKKIVKTESLSHDYKFILCDSGKAYVERLMQEFEFFSNRLSNNNKALYLYKDVTEIEFIINDVYNAVSYCCENMLKFREKYIALNGISDVEYLALPIHPTTSSTRSPQLHTERTIFSHIAYLNNVRRYFLDKEVTPNMETRKEYNRMFVNYIDRYLKLYSEKILPICSKRIFVAKKLARKVDSIQRAISKGSNDLKILFQSISLK